MHSTTPYFITFAFGLASGCNPAPPAAPPVPVTPTATATAAAGASADPAAAAEEVGLTSTARDDRLEISLTLPAGLTSGASVPLTLRFRNISSEPVRIYMLPEAFRALQSLFKVSEADSGKLVFMAPEPRPHGIVVDEKDFPLIPPGEELTFTQSLALADSRLGDGGSFVLRWTYQNKVESWSGGAETLDGTTKPLFGGGLIPHIWLGRLDVEIPFDL